MSSQSDIRLIAASRRRENSRWVVRTSLLLCRLGSCEVSDFEVVREIRFRIVKGVADNGEG